MQAESGIVADFEVGEDFQEEPKTYYELKSQPLKSRSVKPLLTPSAPLLQSERRWVGSAINGGKPAILRIFSFIVVFFKLILLS